MMGKLLRRLSIRKKLVAMIMAATTTVLLLATVGYLVTDYIRAKNELVRMLTTQATLIMENSATPLLFNDRAAAEETLATLAYNRNVRIACLYKPNGELFAEFRANPLSPCPQARTTDGYEFSNNRLHLFANPVVGGDRIGTLYVRTDLEQLRAHIRDHAIIVAGLLLISLAVAYLLSARLQAVVSEPVGSLARTASRVSSEGDYSLRAVRATDDELGTLVDAFNRMLDRIQLREKELSRANEELRREIVERRRAEQERAELLVREREANRLKDEFLATLSHELRTPLNAILGWTRLLRTNAVPPGGLDRALEKVERNAQVQARLVEDLLEVSRIMSGKLYLDVKPFDLVTVANNAIDSIRPAAEARGVTIHRHYHTAVLPTAGDPVRIQQVIWNLLSNAVKFTNSGGRITIALERAGAEDIIIVSDTGVGIDPGFLPNVFETFRQADASSTRSHGGLGLGLSIVRNLVQTHDGSVTAASPGLNQGATFTVKLPVRGAGRQPALHLPPADHATPLANVTVVVVDDDEDTRELLLTVLENAGATVHPASSADEGLAACLEFRTDALVCDVGMPGKDGYSLMRLVSALGPSAPRVSIALTAFATDRDRLRAEEAGFQRHVAKPFDPPALVRLIADLLSETLAR
jgi:signal transduction histidine kinase/ActR/RegA family two-component response regulator